MDKEKKKELKRKKKSSNYKFTDKVHPKQAVASVGMATLTLALLIAACYLSFLKRGEAGMGVGALGTLAFVTSIIGLALGIKSVRTKQEIHYRFPILGIGGNGILAILFLLMYIWGASM